ncbi:MAG: AAA family ATPase, partial [Chloroflexi bacterium]|nr:AAA family ATPase [Chloroflexota bacterium]
MLTLQMKESAQQWGDHKRAPLLNLLFFGSPEITLGGEPVTGFVSAKAKALLCLLAITRRVQSRNALVALFWGDVPEADAKTQLRVALSNLRKLVGDHLQIERETVAFDTTQAYHLDVEEFEKQLADSRLPIAKQDSLSAISQLLSANRAYRGDLLAGMLVRDAPEFEEWLLVQRERLCGMALDGLWTLFQLERARGNTAAALDALKRSVELEPWREEAHREVMLLLARTGKRSAALQQFETCRAVLQRELGVEPASETVHLYERIRAAGTDPRHNLPSPATSFVGRETELQTIVQRLETETRLLTLLGPGGIGKTRLALQAARQQVDRFLNGVFFVSLAQAQDADAVLAAIAHALAFSFSGGEAPRTQLLNYLQEKELLLVLDNFEHLHDGAELVREILARAPAVRVLVTSRERLNLRAEWLLSVRGLPMTQTGADTGAPSAALRLFAERAAQVAPDFDFEHEAAQVHHICALVEGMPLAIELAATWRRMYSADEIVQQIKIDLDFLATTQTDVPAAHSSLRAVFARSWEMLSPREQGAFRGLAVFRGSFTSEAARHVAAIAPPTLQALADKSLVSTLPREASDPGLRFGMHELLRQYALAQFAYAEQQAAALHDKHSAYYAEKLAAQETALKGADTKNAVVGLARDGENIVAAWEWASARTPPDAVVLARMVEPLMVLLELRGEYLAAERLYAHTAAQLEDQNAPNQASEIILARVLTGQSWFCFRLAQFEQGRALSARAFSL